MMISLDLSPIQSPHPESWKKIIIPWKYFWDTSEWNIKWTKISIYFAKNSAKFGLFLVLGYSQNHIYVVGNIVFLFRFCFCEGGHLKEYPYQLVPGDSFIIQVIFPSAILSPTCFISFNLILCLFITVNDLHIIVTAEHWAKIYFQKCCLGKCKNWEEKTYLTTKWFGL